MHHSLLRHRVQKKILFERICTGKILSEQLAKATSKDMKKNICSKSFSDSRNSNKHAETIRYGTS